jgi:hypothetical protein
MRYSKCPWRTRVCAAGNKPIGSIADSENTLTERSRAVVAIDEAVREAVAVDISDLFPSFNAKIVAG